MHEYVLLLLHNVLIESCQYYVLNLQGLTIFRVSIDRIGRQKQTTAEHCNSGTRRLVCRRLSWRSRSSYNFDSSLCPLRHVKASWSVFTRWTALVARVLQSGWPTRNRPQTVRALGNLHRQQWSCALAWNCREQSGGAKVFAGVCVRGLLGESKQQAGASQREVFDRVAQRGSGSQRHQLRGNHRPLQHRGQQQRAFRNTTQVWGRLEWSGKLDSRIY